MYELVCCNGKPVEFFWDYATLRILRDEDGVYHAVSVNSKKPTDNSAWNPVSGDSGLRWIRPLGSMRAWYNTTKDLRIKFSINANGLSLCLFNSGDEQDSLWIFEGEDLSIGDVELEIQYRLNLLPKVTVNGTIGILTRSPVTTEA